MRVVGRGSRTAVAGLLAGALVAGCSDDAAPRGRTSPSGSSTTSESVAPAPRATADAPTAASPRSAAHVTKQIIAAERTIQDPKASGAELRQAAHVQQVAYRVLGGRPGWDDRVLTRLPAGLRSVVRAHVAARREFRSMHPPSDHSSTLPAWRIVAPAPAADLLRYYRRAQARYDVGWEYLAAINLVETGMGRIRGTSVAGAQGPMQFIPSTWARWGRGDVNDPADAIMAAARYLAHNGFAQAGGKAGALYRYNNSTAYVRGVTHYAKLMERRPLTFHGLYHWQIYYVTTAGDVRLPVGYERTQPVPVKRYLAAHPQG